MKKDATLIVPWDFSAHAAAALAYAQAEFPDATIKVVCVLERPNPFNSGVVFGPEVEEDAKHNCVEHFYSVAKLEPQTKGVSFEAIFGDPADRIVATAQNEQADAIVISTHGRTGIRRLFMGSIAQKIAQLSTCPIVLLPNSWFEQTLFAQEPKEAASSKGT